MIYINEVFYNEGICVLIPSLLFWAAANGWRIVKGCDYESSDNICWMEFFVCAVLAGGTAGVNSPSYCLAVVFAVAAYRDNL